MIEIRFGMKNAGKNNRRTTKTIRVTKNGCSHESIIFDVFCANSSQNTFMLNGVTRADSADMNIFLCVEHFRNTMLEFD